MPHPLALYIFTGDTHVAENVIARIGFGGGCINDTLIHLATSEMPSADLAKAAWAVTTERPDLIHYTLQKYCGQEDLAGSANAISALQEDK